MDSPSRPHKRLQIKPIMASGARGMRVATVAVLGLAAASCGGPPIDLYDYFSDESSAPSQQAATAPPSNGGAQPVAGVAGSSAFSGADQALADAQVSNGIEKVSLKNAQGVAVTVDDLPITNFDISQRINLENALGASYGTDIETRKRVLETLINEKVAQSRARKFNFTVEDRELDERIDKMVGRMKISREELKQRLGKKGVDIGTLKRQIAGTLYIRWVMSQQQVDTQIEVDQAAVDAKYNEIANDPRLKPVTVMMIQQIDLPVEKTSEAMHQQLLYARAIEAQQIMQRYKGCNTIRSAAKGIFNVKIGKRLEADRDRLPKEMRAALTKAGTKKLVGPVPGPTGVRLFAYCGSRKIEPPRPSRKQIEAHVRNEQFENLVNQAMVEARRESFVDYRDPVFRP